MDKTVDLEIETEEKSELDEDFKSNVNVPAACFRVPEFDEFDIVEYRKSVGMSQSEFAAAHEISLATLRKWERNVSKPTFDKALKRILTGWLKWENSKLRHQ